MLRVDPSDPRKVVVGGSDGVHRSSDGARSFRTVDHGLSNVAVRRVVADARRPGTAFFTSPSAL